MKRFIFVLLVCSFVSGETAASTVRALSLSDLVSSSDAVVLGRAIRVETHRDKRGNIVRTVKYSVDEYLVGAGDKQILIRLQGGELDGIGRKVPGETDLSPGERTLLFIERVRAGDRIVFVIVGMGQGRFGVVDDQNGRCLFLTRTVGSVNLVGEPRDDSMGLGRAETSTFLSFDTFVDAVGEIARENSN